MVAAVACSPAHQDAGKPSTGPSSRTTAPTPGPTLTSTSPRASADARAGAACGTEQLRWKLTRLAAPSAKEPTALLSATNTGTTPCSFDGYPYVHVYLGKGPAVEAKPKATTPVRLLLNHGRTVEVPLFYPAAPLRDGYCGIPVDEDPEIEVQPPHPARTDYGTLVQMSDTRGRQVRATVCDTILMGSPRLRPTE
ncbi:DUF4232 domain-containing protein [Streptomyces sp. NPDC001393]